MKISARDIDHLSVTASEPAEMATRLGQLGFNLTPEGVEPRCICFQPDRDDIPNYIELLQDDPAQIALALNVAELEGEEGQGDDDVREHVFSFGLGKYEG